MLIGWSDRNIVISFRGTASFRNAIADLQVRAAPINSEGLTTNNDDIFFGYLLAWYNFHVSISFIGRLHEYWLLVFLPSLRVQARATCKAKSS